MKNKLSKSLKVATGYVPALLIVVLSFGFFPVAQAVVAPTLTIGSQSASNGATINVPINATNFTDVAGVDIVIQFDNTKLNYIDTTLNNLPNAFVNSVGNQITITWDDLSNPLNIVNSTLLTLNFTVISATTTNANLSFTGIPALNDSFGEPVAASFVDGVISLNPASNIATITSATYTVSAGGTASETITNVPFGTSKTVFEAALTKGESHQTWTDTGVHNTVVTGDTLVVTAQDGAQVVYAITVNAEVTPAVIINEFSSDSSPEWVELLNTTSSPIVLDGWKIQDFTFSGATITGVHNNVIGSVTIPANGIVVVDVVGLNNDADSITLYDNSATPVVINNVVYGTVATQTTTTGLETAPASGQSAIFVSPSTWSVTGSPTKGWFNDAGQAGKAPLLSTIDSSLHDAGIETNMGELTNPSATPATEVAGALYFEKTGRGKIVFEKVLNMSDQNTVSVLQGLGTAMDMSAGHIEFDSTTAEAMNATGATIHMYGFPHGEGVDAVAQSELVVKDDDGDVIPPTIEGIPNSDYPTISGFTWDNVNGTVTFGASHFTQFFLNDTIKPSIVSFNVPTTSSSLTVSGISVTAHDNRGVAGLMFSELNTPPLASSDKWSSGTPSTYLFATAGPHTLYAWAKDAADNVSLAYDGKPVTITLAKTDQTITFGPLLDKTYGDTPFAVSATASSELPVTFSSQTESICAVSGGTLTIITAGTCTIRASQDGNEGYNAAPDVDQSFTVAQKSLTVSGITASSKVYDRTTGATLTGSGSLVGKVGIDDVVLGGSAVGTFSDKTVGDGKTVNISGLSLVGTTVGNYTLVAPTTTANITAKHITANFVTPSNKVYDGTTSAFLNGCTPTGIISGDTVSLYPNCVIAFSDKNAGVNKSVNLISATLSGADSGNYTVDISGTAYVNVSTKHITGSFTVSNKTYDGNNIATVTGRSLVGAVEGDTVSLSGGTATFSDEVIGDAKTVTLTGATLDGADAGNYVLDSVVTTTADITSVPATPTGVLSRANGNLYIQPNAGSNYLGQLTVTNVSPGTITSLNGIKIKLPFAMGATWVYGDGTLSIGTTTVGAISSNVTYTSSSTILNLNVTNSFDPNESITVDFAFIATGVSTGISTMQYSTDGGVTWQNASFNVIIDGTNPLFTINTPSSTSLVASDTINLSVTDTYLDTVSEYAPHYGFTSGSCAYDTSFPNGTLPFTSGSDIVITGVHNGDYLCAVAADLSGNQSWQLIGPLNVDAEAVAVLAINSATSVGDMATAITNNATILGLDLTDYNTLSDKTPVQATMIGKSYVNKTAIKSAFDSAVTTEKDTEAVAADKGSLTDDSIKGGNADLSHVTLALSSLPASGANGSAITWASNNASVVSNNGQTINRPAFGAGNASVTLTATITKGSASDTKAFTLIVLAEITDPDIAIAQTVTDQITALPAVADLTLPGTAVSDARTSYDALTSGQKALVSNYTTLTNAEAQITALNSATTAVSNLETASGLNLAVEGNLTDAETKVMAANSALTSVIAGGAKTSLQGRLTTATATVTTARTNFNNSVDATAVANDKGALTDDSIKGGNADLSHVTLALSSLPASGANGSAITWASNNASVVSNNGQTINRPAFGAGNASVTLTATITKGSASDTKAFSVTVIESLNSAKAITAFSFSSGTGVINETNHTISVNVPNGTSVTVLVPAIEITGASVNPNTGVAQDFTGTVTYTVTAGDGSTQDYIVTVSILEATQTAPDASGDATSDSDNPEVVITDPDQQVDITVDSGTTDPTIDVSSFITGGTGDIPQITINSTTGSGNAAAATIEIPATTVTGPTDWDGVIAAPTVATVTLPNPSGETRTFSAAVEIGFGEEKLSFGNAVRILLPNQAGKRAGYTRDSGVTFTEITSACSADNQTIGDALGVDSECKINASNGLDLVIWTKHFTTFATYTQTTNYTGGGGGGGGGTTYYAIIASAGVNGAISPVGSTSLTSGSSQTYTITPATGYKIGDVLVDGVSKGAIVTYTFSSVSAGHTISATFSAITTGKSGDTNNDNTVDELDFSLMMADWGKTGTSLADLNNDSVVDELDFSILMADWGL